MTSRIIVNSKKYGKRTILVDDEDYATLKSRKWYVAYTRTTFYAARAWGKDIILMHRSLMKCRLGDGTEVDHINGNGLDNRKFNLRITDRKGNSRNTWRHRSKKDIRELGLR